MYGKVQESPQNEKTNFYPLSPYGSKIICALDNKNYREAYNIFGSNGILFNHESPRRGETFVTKKIIRALVRIKMGKQRSLFLGNLDSKEIGVMQKTMLRRCGRFYSKRNLMIM